jgi:phage baseplate assembly protein W
MATNLGRDTSCTTGLRSGRLVSGARLVAESLYRRLDTRRGTLRGGRDEANFGIRLSDYIGQGDDEFVRSSLPGIITAEATKDIRIDASRLRVAVTRTRPGVGVKYDVRVTGWTDTGPFDIVLQVSAVTVELVGLTAGGT